MLVSMLSPNRCVHWPPILTRVVLSVPVATVASNGLNATAAGSAVALDPLPQLPDLDRGGDLVARRQPADPAGAAIDAVILAAGFAVERHRAEAGLIAAAVAHLLERRQHGADVEERPRRSPVGEIVAQREGADRRAGDAVAAFAVLGVGDARQQRQIGRQVLAAVNAGRERSRRAERADAVAAIDLFVDAEQHRAEHPVGDHLVEALPGQIVDRVRAGSRAGRCRVGSASVRSRRRRWCRRRRGMATGLAKATAGRRGEYVGTALRRGRNGQRRNQQRNRRGKRGRQRSKLRVNFAIVSARTACRWDRCRHRQAA